MSDKNTLIQNWCLEIDSITSEVIESFGSLPENYLNHPGPQNSWSIAENLKHLIVVNSSYFPLFEALLQKTNQSSNPAWKKWLARKMGSFIFKRVSRLRKDKMTTFSNWEPQHHHGNDKIIEQFKEHQEKLKKYIQSCLPLTESGCLISSPANKAIIYRLEDAMHIIVEHEWRHIRQALETADLIK